MIKDASDSGRIIHAVAIDDWYVTQQGRALAIFYKRRLKNVAPGRVPTVGSRT